MPGYSPSSYGDGMAPVYDNLYAIAGTDRACARLAEWASGEALLELGCGTGRLAIPLASQGVKVTAVDASLGMLEVLRSAPGGQSVEAVHADMRDLSPLQGRSYGVVVIAYNTFFQLLGNVDKAACLSAINDLTGEGSLLVVETFIPKSDPDPQAIEVWHMESDRLVLSVSQTDVTTQMARGQAVDIRTGHVELRPWAVHYLTIDQLDDLLQEAGWFLRDRWRDWDLGEFTATSKRQVGLYAREP